MTPLDILARILTNEVVRGILTAAGRAAIRGAANELARRASAGELRPKARRYRRQIPQDRT